MQRLQGISTKHTTDSSNTQPVQPDIAWLAPALLLRLEGAAILALTVLLYWQHGAGWLMFGLLLLAPDLSMLGYLAGPRIGAALYNAFHSYPLPAALASYALLSGSGLALALALIWFAHIGMDRMIGYGLKYAAGFKVTHLERV